MNIFDYNGDEFDKRLEEIFSKTSKEALLRELIECGLEVKLDIDDIEKLEYAIKCNKEQFENLGTHILLQDDEMKAIERLIARCKYLEVRNDLINEQNIKFSNTLENLQKSTISLNKIETKLAWYKEHNLQKEAQALQDLLEDVNI